MTPDERAAMHSFKAAYLRYLAAREQLSAACARTTAGMQALTCAWLEAERREVQQHPDLAELDVQLDGFYG